MRLFTGAPTVQALTVTPPPASAPSKPAQAQAPGQPGPGHCSTDCARGDLGASVPSSGALFFQKSGGRFTWLRIK